MRNFQAHHYTSNNNKTQNKTASTENNDKPDWMKRLQEKKNTQTHKNMDFELFPSLKESVCEITYLDDEDDLAASYFPGCDKMGSSMSTIDNDDLSAVSGYNFDELIR